MKRCGTCKRTLPRREFNLRRRSADGLQPTCKACNRRASADYYARNREGHKRVTAANRDRAVEANRRFVMDYLLRHPCVDCGELDPLVLEFDHVTGEKDRGVYRMLANGVGRRRLQREMAKCQVLCVNCHRRRTARQQGWWLLDHLGA